MKTGVSALLIIMMMMMMIIIIIIIIIIILKSSECFLDIFLINIGQELKKKY